MLSSSYIQNYYIWGRDLEKIAFQNLFYFSKAKDLFERKYFHQYIIHILEMHSKEKMFLIACLILVKIPNINFLKHFAKVFFSSSSKHKSLSWQISSDLDSFITVFFYFPLIISFEISKIISHKLFLCCHWLLVTGFWFLIYWRVGRGCVLFSLEGVWYLFTIYLLKCSPCSLLMNNF